MNFSKEICACSTVNDKKMATLDLRESVLEYVKNADSRFLRLVKALAESYHKEENRVAYSAGGRPLTKKEYNQELLSAEQEFINGSYTTLEDFSNEAKDW